MKKKSRKKYVIAFVIIIAIIFLTIFITRSGADDTVSSSTTTQIVETQVTSRTIQNTLTSSGQISSASSEKLELSTSKYFSTMCVEEDDTVKMGENILKYTNGTYLTAPYDLVITSYSVPETGSKCTSSNYVEVQNLETLQMTISIDESEINNVEVGQTAEVILSANEEKTYEATITKIGAVGNYQTSGTTFTAILQFENDGEVKLGMSASCTVILEEAEDTLAVPIEAIQTKDDTKYVIVVNEDGTTKDVTVETGISDDSYVQIISGLDGTETIQMLQTTSSTGIRNVSRGESSQSGFDAGFGTMDRQGGTGGMPNMGGGMNS